MWVWYQTRALHVPNLKNDGVELKGSQNHTKLLRVLRYESSKDEPLSHLMPHSGLLLSLPLDVCGCSHPALEQDEFEQPCPPPCL